MKKYILLGALSLGLVLTGFGCKTPAPEQVLESMKVAMANQDSAKYVVTGKIDATSIDGPTNSELQSAIPGVTEFLFSLSGVFNQDEETLLDQQGEFSFEMKGDQPLALS
jgi:hypothetical protein